MQAKFFYEVFVIDNASNDGSPEMVREEFPQVKLIENEKNLGFARANNLAIKDILKIGRDSTSPLIPPLARGGGNGGRYILLLNSDVEIFSDTFDKMISYMDNNPTVGISGCKVIKPDGKLDLACRRRFPDPANALFRLTGLSFLFPKSRFSSYNLTYLPDDEITEVDSVMGAFLLIRREVVQKIGLLDENFFMYGEDLDWCYRAKEAHYKVMYVPITHVVHHKGSSSRKASRLALYEFHHAMQLFYDKHYRLKYNFLVNYLVKIGIWMRYLAKFLQNSLRSQKYVSR